MATIASTEAPTKRSRILTKIWAAMGGTDDGEWIEISHLQDRTVHVYGTFGSGTVTIQGSNEAAPGQPGANAVTLRDPAGNALTFTTTGLKAILELPRWIRPVVTGGTASSINVAINGRGDTR